MQVGVRTVEMRCETRNTVRPGKKRRRLAQDLRSSVCVSTAEEAVVEHQHLGVAQQGAGQGDPLLLPSREGDAALADHGVESLRETAEVRRRSAAMLAAQRTPASGRLGPTPKAMFSRTVCREEEGLLRHHGDRAAQAAERQTAHVDAVEEDAYLRGGSSSRASSDNRVDLPAPGASDDGDAAPGGHSERRPRRAPASARPG